MGSVTSTIDYQSVENAVSPVPTIAERLIQNQLFDRSSKENRQTRVPIPASRRCRYSDLTRSCQTGNNTFQVGKLSFFNNAANRGSWCKLFSRGSTLVSMRPALRWT
jgi:hypothetical protein